MTCSANRVVGSDVALSISVIVTRLPAEISSRASGRGLRPYSGALSSSVARYRSTHWRGVTTVIPLQPFTWSRCLSPDTISGVRAAIAHARNLSSSGSADTGSARTGASTMRRGLGEQRQGRAQWVCECGVARREDGARLVVLGQDGGGQHEHEPIVLPSRQQPTRDATEEDPGEENVRVHDGAQRPGARHGSDHARRRGITLACSSDGARGPQRPRLSRRSAAARSASRPSEPSGRGQ